MERGTFTEVADDSTVTIGANEFRISYNGADNNDTAVVLIAVLEPSTAILLLGGIACLLHPRRRTTP